MMNGVSHEPGARWVRGLGSFNLRVFAMVGAIIAGGCDLEPGDDHTLSIETTGNVEGSAYLDLDANGSRDGGDPSVTGVLVEVRTLAGGIVASDETGVIGGFLMDQIPVGTYQLGVDEATIPDSLVISELDSSPFRLDVDENESREIGLSFASFSLEELREIEPGRPIQTQGIALNRRPNFGDGVVHFREGDVYLRATNVDRVDITPGDSVRIVGRTASDVGLPILDDVTVTRLIPQAALVDPVELTTAQAASADSGELDAALVRIRNATVTATASAPDGGLTVTADDGSGPVEIVMRRGYLETDPAPFQPDSTRFAEAIGLLVPFESDGGTIRWRMTPRDDGDLDLEEIPSDDP